MCKRLISVFLAFLIPLSLFGCMSGDTTLYNIYTTTEGSGPDIFRDDTPTADQIPQSGSGTDTENPAPTKEILFQDQLHTLNYQGQDSRKLYAYTCSDGAITCHFAPNSGYLRTLSSDAWLDPEAATSMTEDDYLNWVKEQVSAYYSEDWEQYTLTCTTEFRDNFHGKESIQKESGFFAPADSHEVIEAYTFTFTKYLGDYTTTDVIRAYIRPQTGYVSLEFSPHEFDHTLPVKIDTNLIQASVFRFLSDYVGKSKYAYTKHSSIKPSLSYINGQLVLLCTIQIDVTSLNDDAKFESEITLQPVAILLQQ